MAPQRPPQKKQRLTLAQLASYDDILTDALVDHVCHSSIYLSPDPLLTSQIGILLDHHPKEP
jgi:hypothetical protein